MGATSLRGVALLCTRCNGAACFLGYAHGDQMGMGVARGTNFLIFVALVQPSHSVFDNRRPVAMFHGEEARFQQSNMFENWLPFGYFQQHDG